MRADGTRERGSPDSPASGVSLTDMSGMRLAFDRALEEFLAEELRDLEPPVADAVRYAVLSPGKRIRIDP